MDEKCSTNLKMPKHTCGHEVEEKWVLRLHFPSVSILSSIDNKIVCEICHMDFVAEYPMVGDNIECPCCYSDCYGTYDSAGEYTTEWVTSVYFYMLTKDE